MNTFKCAHDSRTIHGKFQKVIADKEIPGRVEIEAVIESNPVKLSGYFCGSANRFVPDDDSIYQDLESIYENHVELSAKIGDHLESYLKKISIPAVLAYYNTISGDRPIFIEGHSVYEVFHNRYKRKADVDRVFKHLNNSDFDYNIYMFAS